MNITNCCKHDPMNDRQTLNTMYRDMLGCIQKRECTAKGMGEDNGRLDSTQCQTRV